MAKAATKAPAKAKTRKVVVTTTMTVPADVKIPALKAQVKAALEPHPGVPWTKAGVRSIDADTL